MSPKKQSPPFSYAPLRNSTALESGRNQRSGNNERNRQGWFQPRNWVSFLTVMWHRLKNLFFTLKNYDLLSPNLAMRRQVKGALRHRSELGMADWFEAFCKPLKGAYPVVNFLYNHLEAYSGITLGKLRPSDRLEEDLHWTDLCGFDWQVMLCEDFMQQFNIDMTSCLENFNPHTVEDLVTLLHREFQRQ
jgi:hypothetical protein